MGISSLGAGSGILTQDVLDQLRAADDAAQVTPITYDIANENDKKSALEVIDASMANLSDAIAELSTPLLYDERSVSTVGSSISMTADANSDIQEFTLDVTQLATKQIEESGSFTSNTDTIATAAGSVNLNIDGVDFTINYDATTTLDDFKQAINDVAGDNVNATIVQVSTGDYRLFLSSTNTGSTQDITLTDNSGNLSGTQLTTGMTAVQTGVDANFTYNGQAVTRSSNNVTDLVVGYDITLKELGSTSVSVDQNRDNILSRIDSFVSKYNAAIKEIDATTKVSTDSAERGIFSSESTIKSMKTSLENMLGNAGGGVGTLYEYGFDIDRDGVMTVDKDIINAKMDEDSTNFEAFFSGGSFTNVDGTTTELTGAFGEMNTLVDGYTKYNATLDQFNDSIVNRISSLEDRKTSATERLDSKYEILKKQYAAYDAMIAGYNQSSDIFTQLANDANA